MTSPYHDYHDIIIYPLIIKESLIKKFPNRLIPISFCLLDRNTYSLVFTGVYQIPISFTFKIFNNLFQDFSLSTLCLRIQELQEKLTITISVRLKIGSKKEKKQPNVKKKLTDYEDF